MYEHYLLSNAGKLFLILYIGDNILSSTCTLIQMNA